MRGIPTANRKVALTMYASSLCFTIRTEKSCVARLIHGTIRLTSTPLSSFPDSTNPPRKPRSHASQKHRAEDHAPDQRPRYQQDARTQDERHVLRQIA
eukprot:CAMPEP_0182801192 /NCGR_PEP_ID=MMETSP0006_2-20121128/2819_1 /TAXON_ID=97485 /ORGANISM="Prymnesium parvum, Strain Texoma1" /LENGTH=97 /DNA_ID=CAMNT_0024926493 /DNA_START=1435 /DNA_END=1728 /DNA_ORIENTATION=-